MNASETAGKPATSRRRVRKTPVEQIGTSETTLVNEKIVGQDIPKTAERDVVKKPRAKKTVPPKEAETTGSAPADATESAEKPEAAPIRAGAKKVLVEPIRMLGKRGPQPAEEEDYPFAALAPSENIPGTNDLFGPSFHIPATDNPDARLASARKRHQGKFAFASRSMEYVDPDDPTATPVPGLRIWKRPDSDVRKFDKLSVGLNLTLR